MIEDPCIDHNPTAYARIREQTKAYENERTLELEKSKGIYVTRGRNETDNGYSKKAIEILTNKN